MPQERAAQNQELIEGGQYKSQVRKHRGKDS
jgi:hypothetical protein